MTRLPDCSEYMISLETPQLIKAAELQGGRAVTQNGRMLRYAGGFCVVFPYEMSSGDKVAVRCWTAHVPDAEKRSRQISQSLRNSELPYFVRFDYIDCGIATQLGVFPIIIMDWIDAKPMKAYIQNNINYPAAIKALADKFLEMTNDLHKVGFSHGDLQHGNIMVSQTGQLFLVDYDSMYVPGLEDVTDEIKGLVGYQHPARTKLKCLSPKSDYFSELIIYTSLLALSKYPSLWESLNIEDTETLVFSQADFDNPSGSIIFKILKKADSEMAECVNAIEDALSKPSIEDLKPLNEVVVPKSQKIIGGLRERWNSRPEPKIFEPEFDKKEMRVKWDKSNQIKTEKTINISSISSKWK